MERDGLISRAASISEIDEYLQGLDSCISEPDLKLDGYRNGLQVAIQELKALPAVDAVPVVHAQWIETKIPANTTGHGGVGQDKKNGLLCSNCRCAFDVKLLWIKNYCPGCGAKMESNDQLG